MYAAIARPGGLAEANAGIVDLGGRILIFDTLMSPLAAADLRRVAEELTGHPVYYVVNSHWHLDHIRGNQVFEPDTLIISTEITRSLIDKDGRADLADDLAGGYLELVRRRIAEADDLAIRAEWSGVLRVFERISATAADVRIRAPDLGFERRLVLYGPARRAELLSFGGGETASDAVLYLPVEQLLFTGDLASVAMQPLVTGGDVAVWDRILEELAALPVHTILPGHGPIGAQADLRLTQQYLRRLQEVVRQALADGSPAAPPGPPFDSWTGRRFWDLNVRHLTTAT